MADRTGIEWTESTWNPIVGCSLVSPGCTNCYAMRMAGRIVRMNPGSHYAGTVKNTKADSVWTGVMNPAPDHVLAQPLRWRRPRYVFVNSMSDLFHEGVPDDLIDRVFAVMALAPQHTFQILTKRPERMRNYLSRDWASRARQALSNLTVPVGRSIARDGRELLSRYGSAHFGAPCPLPNVWLGVSAEDQRRADERVPLLIDTPAAVRWISAEPLLGPIDFRFFRQPNMGGGPWWFDALNRKRAGWFADEAATVPTDDPSDHDPYVPRLDWIVVGGESGHGARPMHPEWARSIRDQCAVAGVPFLFKQWGRWSVHEIANGGTITPGMDMTKLAGIRVWAGAGFACPAPKAPVSEVFFDGAVLAVPCGKKRAGRHLDGVLHDAYPQSEEIIF